MRISDNGGFLRAGFLGSICMAVILPTALSAQTRTDFFTVESGNFMFFFNDEGPFPDYDCMHSALQIPNGAVLQNVRVFPSVPEKVNDEEKDISYKIALVETPKAGEPVMLLEEEVPIYIVGGKADGEIVLMESYKFSLDGTINSQINKYTIFACIDNLGAIDVEHHFASWGRIRYTVED